MTIPRKFKVGYAHHVFNRGNQKEKIFLQPKDYGVFLKQLHKYSDIYECNILAYCLMPNHYHLLLQPMTLNSIPNTMQRTTTMYSKYLKIEHKWVGHVFQGRYQNKIVNTVKYLDDLVLYFRENPKELDLTDPNGDYRWLKIYDERISIQRLTTPG